MKTARILSALFAGLIVLSFLCLNLDSLPEEKYEWAVASVYVNDPLVNTEAEVLEKHPELRLAKEKLHRANELLLSGQPARGNAVSLVSSAGRKAGRRHKEQARQLRSEAEGILDGFIRGHLSEKAGELSP